MELAQKKSEDFLLKSYRSKNEVLKKLQNTYLHKISHFLSESPQVEIIVVHLRKLISQLNEQRNSKVL